MLLDNVLVRPLLWLLRSRVLTSCGTFLQLSLGKGFVGTADSTSPSALPVPRCPSRALTSRRPARPHSVAPERPPG